MADSRTSRRTGSAAVRIALRAIVGITALAAAFGLFQYLSASAPKPAEKPAEALTRTARVMVATEVPTRRRWEAFGTARPLNATTVAAEVAGVIVERPEHIQPGVAVEGPDPAQGTPGELLVRIDDTEYVRRRDAAQRRVESLRAQLETLEVERRSLAGHQDDEVYRRGRVELADEAADIARQDLERVRRAAERGSASPSEVDAVRSQLTAALRTAQQLREQLASIPSRVKATEADILSAEADALVADLNYRRTEVRVPMTGQLQRIDVDEGDRVAPGSTVARIVDLSRIEIPLKVPASASATVREGDTARLRSTGITDQTWTGEVDRIAPEADPNDRTVTVFVVVQQSGSTNNDDLLRPGQFLNGRVIASTPKPAVVLPRIAIRDDDTVLIIDDNNTIALRRVDVAFRLEESDAFDHLVPGETEWAALATLAHTSAADPTPPLEAGDLVVLSNVNSLRPGVSVQPQIVSTPTPDDGGTNPPVAATVDESPEGIDLR